MGFVILRENTSWMQKMSQMQWRWMFQSCLAGWQMPVATFCSLPGVSENLGWSIWKHDVFSLSTDVTMCTNEAADSWKGCVSLGFRCDTLIAEDLMSMLFLLLVTNWAFDPVKQEISQTWATSQSSCCRVNNIDSTTQAGEW